MDHPPSVLYLEHDGKVLLVDEEGNGPYLPETNRIGPTKYRLPTTEEATALGLSWAVKN